MRKLFTILLSILFFSFAHSQNLSKAFQRIENKDLASSVEIFKEALKNSKEPIIAKYGLAIIYSDTSYKKSSYIKAYKYINYSSEKLRKYDESAKLLNKYDIPENAINKLKEKICKDAYNQIQDKNSPIELSKYLQIYKNSDFSKMITLRRDSLEFYNAKKSEDFREFQKFHIAHPDSKFAAQAQGIFKKLWMEEYESYASYGEIEMIYNFEQKYPDYPFYNEESKKNKEFAQTAYELNLYKKYNSNNEKKYLQFIKDAAPRETAYLALMKVVENSINAKDYENVIKIIKENIVYFKGKDQRLTKLIKILEAPEQNIKAESISPNINTKAWEYSVTETADGKKIYFCGRNRDENLSQNNEDIFMSVKSNNQWSKPKPVSAINTEYGHEAPLSVTADGNRLLLYSNSDIYYTDKIKGGWTGKSKFPIINNPDSWEADAMITADGNAIFFISDRKGNIGNDQAYGTKFHAGNNGNTDIYVSIKTPNGWSKPQNIGSIVNTPFAERSPFLHSDMKTLYFSSDGHGGLGKFDVFMSKKLSDTSWTQWSEPVNLGKEINSVKDEYGYKISTTGDYAYFSGFQNNNFDIYTVKLPENMKPETVTVVSGKILDNTNNSIYATIVWENLETGEQIGFSKSNPDNGNYIIILPNGKNYGYFIDKTDYYPASGNIELTEIKGNNEFKKDIKLFSYDEILNKKISIPLANLFFDSNKYTIKKESFPELNRLAEFIISHKNVYAEISGHTDNKGSLEYNMKLSQDRANEIKKYLVSKGCNSEKLKAIGYGPTKPITSNETEINRAENRRVEFKILK